MASRWNAMNFMLFPWHFSGKKGMLGYAQLSNFLTKTALCFVSNQKITISFQLAYIITGRNLKMNCLSCLCIVISRRAKGPGWEILQCPPSVCPSVCLSIRLSIHLSVSFSFRTVTRKRIDVFSLNFAGTCTMSWGCAV